MEQAVRNMRLEVSESRCHAKDGFSNELHGENKEQRSLWTFEWGSQGLEWKNLFLSFPSQSDWPVLQCVTNNACMS